MIHAIAVPDICTKYLFARIMAAFEGASKSKPLPRDNDIGERKNESDLAWPWCDYHVSLVPRRPPGPSPAPLVSSRLMALANTRALLRYMYRLGRRAGERAGTVHTRE